MEDHEVNDTGISLIPVNNLLKQKFYVPSYQRGYRWTPVQVSELLDDIMEFYEKMNKGQFYCLQPLVVAKKDDSWILIDGQQRLTTVYLILSYFNDRLAEKHKKTLYTLTYQTRPDSAKYLQNITESQKDDNIDYYHMYHAKDTISKWFEGKENIVNDYESTVLNSVKFIWYEVHQGPDPIDVFARLNSGRIPLNNAELIKALFLRRGNFAKNLDINIYSEQLRIATEWDRIEYKLQESPFWFFLTDQSVAYSARIEFIFDLMKSKPGHSDQYYTFHKFNDDFDKNGNIQAHWEQVKTYFMTFDEWYSDRELFHLIGFLIETGSSLSGLKSNAGIKTKTAFKAYLRNEIKKKVKYNLDDLDYENDGSAIKTILLLFNVVTILSNEKSYLRFPFDLYKPDKSDLQQKRLKWDIEHIRSKKSDKPVGNKQRGWLQDVEGYFIGTTSTAVGSDKFEHLNDSEKELTQRVGQLLGKGKIDEAEFTQLYDELLVHFHENDEPADINMISNLALLDAGTNRSYKNAVFPVKRKTIMQKDMQGTFVPICTKNVFLKSYSSKLEGSMHWHSSDADEYFIAMKNILAPYLPTPEEEAVNG